MIQCEELAASAATVEPGVTATLEAGAFQNRLECPGSFVHR